MPLKIKLPLDTRKQTLSCQNCPYTTKNKTQFEEHGRDCDRVVEDRLNMDVSRGEGYKVEDDSGVGMVNGGKVENGCNGADESELSIDEGSSINGEESNEHKVVVRHYTCKSCGFQTTTSKTFLFHQRHEHQADFDIFPCDICDYASKWKCKVIRHREMIHRSAPHMAMQDYAKLKSPHRVFGKPGPKIDGKPRKTPLSMVPIPDMIPIPKIKNLKKGLDGIMPLTQLNGSSLIGEKKKKKGVKRKLDQEETAPVKKRVTDGRSQPRSNFLQFMELCSTDGQEPRYKCKLCFYSNLRKWQIRQHIKARHVNAKSFTCNIGKCTFSTYKKAEFFAHKTKHNQVTFECEECEYVTFLKPNLDRHKLNHGMLGVPYKCSLCSYASAKEAAVMRHIQEHHLAKEKQVVTIDGQPVQRSKPRSKKKHKAVKLPVTTTDMVNNGNTSPSDMKETTLETFYAQLRDAVDGSSSASKGLYVTDGFYDQHEMSPSVMSDYNDVGREEGAQKEDSSDAIGDTAFMCPECGFAANSVAKLDKHMMTHGYNMELNEIEQPEQKQTPEPQVFEHKPEEPNVLRFLEEDFGRYNEESIVRRSVAEYFETNGTDSELSNFKASDNSFSEDQASVDCPSAEQNALVSTNGDIVCSICGYVAVTMTRLKGHMVSHSNDFKYTCDLCPRKYKRSSDLNYHMKKAHNIRLRDYLQGSKEQDEPLNLSMRSNTSNDSSIDTDMPEPMDFIEDGPLPEDNDFREQPLDLSHHTGLDEEELIGADMQCPQCPYVAKWPSDMRRHQLVHTGDRRHRCHLCPRSYKWQGDLNVHMKKCHDRVEKSVSPIPPPPAPLLKTFHTQNKARKGVAGEYRCRYCNYIAKYTSELMRHTRIHTHEKPYSCSFCQYDTAWKGDLKRHIEKHHADRLQDEKAIYNILQDIEREVTETYCSDYLPQESDATSVISDDSEPLASSTPQKVALSADRREEDFVPEAFQPKLEARNDAADPCLCKICGWRAPMPSKLHMHLVAHDNIKVYKCTICGFRTNWVWDTRKHVRAKHGLSDPGPYCLKMNEVEARASIAAYLETRERPGRTMSTLNNNNNIEKEWVPAKPILGVPIKLEKDIGNAGMKSTSPHHGYARPFKCSACPRRSNWKWELKKHIKLVHEGQAQIVILSREEALATLPPGLTPGMKLNIGDSVKVPEKPKPTILKTPSAASVSALFHSPSGKPLPITIPPSTPSPAKSFISVVSTPSPSVSGKGSNQVDHDKSKKFKCSSCPYRSNYRSDVQRHVYNKHRKAGEVIILDKETALATLQDYLDTFPGKKFMGRSKRLKLEKQMEGLNTGNGTKDLDKWKCNKCDFRHSDRDAVIEHLSQHSSPKAVLYCCKICPYSNEMCSTVRRHIRSIHELPDEGNFFLNEVEEHPAMTFGKAEPKIEKITDMYKFEPDENIELPPGEGFVEKRFRCKHCGARSNWKNAMYRHIREVHNLTSYNLIEELTEGPDGLVSIPHIPRGEAAPMVFPYKSPDCNATSTKDVESLAGQQDMLLNMSYGVGMAMNGDHNWNGDQSNAGESSRSDGGQHEGQNDWDKEPADSNCGKKASKGKGSGSNEGRSESNAGQGGACGGPNERGKGDSGAGGGQDGDGKKPDGDGKKKGKKKKKKKKLEKEKKGKEKKSKKEKKESKQLTLDDLTFSKVKDKSGALDKKMEQEKSDLEKEMLKTLKPKIALETKGEIYKEGKIYKCSLCPYNTVKSQNVLIHQRLHVKRPGHDVKCPHCPYYVALPRFLKQHLKCHTVSSGKTETALKEMKPSDKEMDGDKTSPTPMEVENGESENIFHVEVIKPGSSKDKEEVVRVEVEKPTKRSKAAKESSVVAGTTERIGQELNPEVEKPAKSRKSCGDDNTFVSDFNRKMYDCSMCPYFSKSKADMLYHKQFHRKRALVKYKCQHCDYWAMHKRVISQHEKLHNPTWRTNRLKTLKQLLVKDSEKKAAPPAVVPPSVQSSPAKSEVSERSYYADYDPVDIASIKQELILSKITAVPVSTLPTEGEEEEVLAKKLEDSPEETQEDEELVPKTDAEEAVIDVETVDPPAQETKAPEEPNPGVSSIDPKKKKVIPVKKLHRCRHCPYTNIRGTNLRQHEKMHGFREDEHLVKCPKCDYHVGNKGLLTHHLKVHADNYQPEFIEPDVVDEEIGDVDEQQEVLQPPSLEAPFAPKQDGVPFVVKYDDMLEEHVVQPTIFKKYSCEKCPYGTSKRSQYEKHFLLHGSKQKFTCEFCDYSVPLNSLLVQHKKLHLMPNQNLLGVQSISNLRNLPELPADVAVAMVADVDEVPQDPIARYSGTHDHLELFENGMEYEEPKKLYRCDRCPFTNVRRDHLLTHLKCHMIRSDLQCPYCDYSVTKEHLLTQHVKVHFGPLTVEEEIIFNGENRAKVNQENGIDLSKNGNLGLLKPDAKTIEMVTEKVEEKEPEVPEKMPVPVPREAEERPHLTDPRDDDTTDEWRCQYCDRKFPASSSLIKHEMQHLIGCHF
ncbi:uncharacterized protein LOC135495354 [Lineus longissimus]|uniref:uncharacterized protein LOC135495354 n=1 Tax=Lineus longissimus TaxID=88925 RepID=UPI002B4CCFB4